jgi:ketosteroid isomerase-like protein
LRPCWSVTPLGNRKYEDRGGPGSFEVTDLRIAASDTVAYCHALLKFFDSTAGVRIGLRKARGKWLVAHEHTPIQ